MFVPAFVEVQKERVTNNVDHEVAVDEFQRISVDSDGGGGGENNLRIDASMTNPIFGNFLCMLLFF